MEAFFALLDIWFAAATTALLIMVMGAILTVILSVPMERSREIVGGPLLPPRRKRRVRRVPRLHPPFHASEHQ